MKIQYYCEVNPEVHLLPDYDLKPETPWYGVKGLWYEGAPYQGKKTKIFALMGYPDVKEGEKVPAVVLIHGGGGHPFAEWIHIWNKRGYAAIAIDTTGYFPKAEFAGVIGTEKAKEDYKFTRELYGELAEEGYTTGPDNSEMKDYELPYEEQWMYQAVVGTILAHNILRADDRIDENKIGISGISWGSVITSITIGYDTRYAFAIPIYGSAHLDDLPAPEIPRVFGIPEVKKYWSAADRLQNVKFPILWQCFCEDTCFHFGANSLSYLDTKEQGAVLSIVRGMGHSHACGWKPIEGYRFADKVLAGKLPFVKCITEPETFGKFSFKIEVPFDYEKVTAEIFYLMEPAEYDEENHLVSEWNSVMANIGEQGLVTGEVPEDAYGYFVEFRGMVEEETYISTSSWVRR